MERATAAGNELDLVFDSLAPVIALTDVDAACRHGQVHQGSSQTTVDPGLPS